MHDRATVAAALLLREERGLSASAISARLGVGRSTIRDWLAGCPPRSHGADRCSACGGPPHRFQSLPIDYVYLFGLYLGDGTLSEHPRGVFRLRIVLDDRYPGIIASAAQAIREVRSGTVHIRRRSDSCSEVSSYWRAWPCLLPQHGSGKKHERDIQLTEWQQTLVRCHPTGLLRGLMQSDGCRFQNTGRNWSAPRYVFSNRSADIHRLFRDACELIDVRWTASGTDKTYVSRVADVARLDEFIGPKR